MPGLTPGTALGYSAWPMSPQKRLMAVLAHPDDESLGFGGTFAKYADEGVRTFLVTATRGQSGRYGDGDTHPGPEKLGRIREAELRAAAKELNISDLAILEYVDGKLDSAPVPQVVEEIAGHIRRARPQVVATFDPSGAYGHPDHVAISQFTTAALVAAADASRQIDDLEPHAVQKLYFMAWPRDHWDIYQKTFKRLVSKVDGVERQAAPWPDWSLTTEVDARSHWQRVWKAIRCHQSQMAMYRNLESLSDREHEMLWGAQKLYRAMSLVNGGRRRETDIFEGVR